MIKIEFSKQEIKALAHERYHYPHPRVQRKMEALWLKSQQIPHHDICRLTGITKATLCTYLRAYQQGGIEALKVLSFYRPTSELKIHTTTLADYFREYPPASVKEAMSLIEEITGIKRSETQIRHFMKELGLKLRKIGRVPAKADPEKQKAFLDEKLQPRLNEAQSGQRCVFFVDAAHFVLAPFLGGLWSFGRLFVKAPAGRKRFNGLGAINAITHELIMVNNDAYINAQSVCDLLWKISRQNIGLPITLVMDNARYQKCRLVWELAETLNIELLYLPSYSPNLNLIERLWKFVKKKCLYSKYYPEFDSFKAAISECLAHTHDTYKEELDSLLTLNFQTFEEVEFVTL